MPPNQLTGGGAIHAALDRMTEDETRVSEVWYGTSPDSLDQVVSVTGNQERYRFRGYRSPYTHEVMLRGLSTQNTLYYYKVGDPREGWSKTFSFYTRSLHPDADVRVFAFADQDMRGPSQKVIEAMSKRNYDFHYLIHAGDINYSDGRDPEVWDEYGEMMEPLLASLPSVYALGNHEKERRDGKDDQTIDPYMYRFRHGEIGRQQDDAWWSVNMGPIHVVMLSSEHHSQSEPWRCRGCTERQAAFLERDLSEAAKPENRQLRPWIVVVVHRPFYNAGRNGLWHLQKKEFEPILERYRVNLVVEGHCHNYERTYPVYDGEITNRGEGKYDNPYVQEVFEPSQGTQGQIHLIIGTGGAKSNGPCPRTDLTLGEVHWPGWGYGMFEANRRRLKFQYVDTDGKTLDEFMICSRKDCAAPPTLPGIEPGPSTISPIVKGVSDTRSKTWVPGFWDERSETWREGRWEYGPPGSAAPDSALQPSTASTASLGRLDDAKTGVTDVVTQPHIPAATLAPVAAEELHELCPAEDMAKLCLALPAADRQACIAVSLKLQQAQEQAAPAPDARTVSREAPVGGNQVGDWEDEPATVQIPLVTLPGGYVVDGAEQDEILDMLAENRNSTGPMDALTHMFTNVKDELTTNTPLMIGVIAGIIVLLEVALIIGICVCCRRRAEKMREKQPLIASNAISTPHDASSTAGSGREMKNIHAATPEDSTCHSEITATYEAGESTAPNK